MGAKERTECEEIAEAMTRRRLLRVDEVVELAVQLLTRLEVLHRSGASLGRLGSARSGAAGAPKPADDIWCAGAVLFHALALQEPRSPAPPLRSVRRDLPEWLGGVVDRALAADPAARWASATEMADALRAGRSGPEMDLDWEQHEDRTVGIVSPLDEAAPAAAAAEGAVPAAEVVQRRPHSRPPAAPVPEVRWRARRRGRVWDLLVLPPVGAAAGMAVGAFAGAGWTTPAWVPGAYGLLAGAVLAGILLLVRTRKKS